MFFLVKRAANFGQLAAGHKRKKGMGMELLLSILTILGVLAKVVLSVWLVLLFAGLCHNTGAIKDRLEAAAKDEEEGV